MLKIMKDSIQKTYMFGTDLANTDSVLNIAYGVDKNFMFGAAISMQSICDYNSTLNLKFHIFTDYIDDEYLARAELFSKKSNVHLSIYVVSQDFVKIFPSVKQWSHATFFRFLAFEKLSYICDRVLYIDADVICKDDILSLNELNFDSEKYVAVVKDNAYMQGKPAERLNVPGLAGNYFNAGVIYLNLSEWKRRGFIHKAISMLNDDPNHMKYKCLDQDILNILFFGGCIYLNNAFNQLYGIDYDLRNKSGSEYLKSIKSDTKLIHYVGITKPWHTWATYPSGKFFRDAYNHSAWFDIPLLDASGEKQYKVRFRHSFKKRLISQSIIYYIKYQTVKVLNKLGSK